MDASLKQLRDLIQVDIGGRGLATDPQRNLINACPGDFAAACAGLALTPRPVVGVITGFYIASAQPPAGETDGPLGAIFLARALVPLGCEVVLYTDSFCIDALRAGLQASGLQHQVRLVRLLDHAQATAQSKRECADWFRATMARRRLTHLIALERPGPSHTLESLQRQFGREALGQVYLDFLDAVPPEHQDRCHTMRGRDITPHMSPAHRFFELADEAGITTIGIGDGGNEIGMGKIPWDVIARNIPGGGLVACRVATQQLIACGVSNWGAYALGRGVWLLRQQTFPERLADGGEERRILEAMVERGPLVDGITGKASLSVDGLAFDDYIRVLPQLAQVS